MLAVVVMVLTVLVEFAVVATFSEPSLGLALGVIAIGLVFAGLPLAGLAMVTMVVTHLVTYPMTRQRWHVASAGVVGGLFYLVPLARDDLSAALGISLLLGMAAAVGRLAVVPLARPSGVSTHRGWCARSAA